MTIFRKSFCSLFLVFFVLSFSYSAYAVSEEEKTFLSLYFSDEELFVVSSTRSLKSVARIAENVEVVTAEDIELMNSHTVAEALYNVTGVEMMHFKGPGSGGFPSIHGSDLSRVSVFLDGVPLQNPNNSASMAVLPVQMIRKIEIIKGPASATWGSSFGGVINIITRSADAGDHAGGSLYASGGERNTSDLRAEITGRKGGLGIYLYGGTMNSDGLLRGHEFWHNNFFSRVSIDSGRKTVIDLSFYYHKSDSLNIDFSELSRDAQNAFALETIYGKARLQKSIGEAVELNFSAWVLSQDAKLYEDRVSTGVRLSEVSTVFDRYGLSGRLTFRSGDHTLVAGTELMDGRLRRDAEPNNVLNQRKYAFFINDTFTAGKLGLVPGLRFDHTNLGGDMVSPSLEMTYQASKDLLLRAVVSRGFHDPAITKFADAPAIGFVANAGLRPEKIWSYQAGAEANIHDLLRGKLSFFYHDIYDIMLDKSLGGRLVTVVNGGRARTTGGEFEIATKKNRGLVLKSGFHYERIELVDFSNIRFF